jgi:flavin-dependent dehydrogenase
MTRAEEQCDVLVIGGGPGGSMASTLLASYGKHVVLLESARFPRYHIGESLLSGTADLLRRIGVLDEMETKGYIKKYGVEWVWGEKREPWCVYFADALAMPYDYGYQVERGEFDHMLLRNARAHGVDAREEHRVTGYTFEADGTALVDFQGPDGAPGRISARWIVDASGQGGLVTKGEHRQEWDPYLRNMAVWTYWRGARRGGGIDAGNTFLPTFADGWWWFIPLRDDITSVGAVVDREAFREQKAAGQKAGGQKAGGQKAGGLQRYYLDCLAGTPELRDRLANAEQVGEMHAQRDWSYSYDRFSGDGYIAIGDAACFIDPLFSTGVHLAMLSGFLASVVVNTVLDKPELDRKRVLDFYENAYRTEFARLRAQVYFLYGGHGGTKESYFWHARSQFDVPGIAPEKAFISLIAGAFQHRSWYRRFLEQLDVPSDLRGTIEDIFDGRAAGTGVGLDAVLVRTAGCADVDDLAIDGAYLRESRSMRHPDGGTLALTPALRTLLGATDGTRSGSQLIEEIVRHEQGPPERAQQLVHEAISFGFLTSMGGSTC